MNKLITRIKRNPFHAAVFLCAGTISFPALHFTFYLMALIGLITSWPLRLEERNHTLRFVTLILIVYITWSIISLVYTEDLRRGLSQLEKRIPLLVLVLTLVLVKKKNYPALNEVLKFYFFGILVSLLFISFKTLYLVYTSYLGPFVILNGISSIDYSGMLQHRTYYGTSVLLILPYLFEQLKHNNNRIKIISLASLLLITLVLVLSGSRSILLAMVFVVLYLIYFYSVSVIKNKVVLKSVWAVLIIGVTLIGYFHPRINTSVKLLVRGQQIEKVESRFATWYAAKELVLDNFLLGVGIGDTKKEIINEYKELNYLSEVSNQLNAHNQYLETFMESGILGLILLLAAMIGVLIAAEKNKRKYVIVFAIVYGIGFVFESMLVRNIGVIPLVFWMLLLLRFPHKEISTESGFQKSNWIAVVILGVFMMNMLGITAYTKQNLFDASDPRTYITANLQVLKYDELNSREQLPLETDAFLINRFIPDFRKYPDGDFIAMDIFKLDNKQVENATFSLWCYVTPNSDIESAMIYAWDKMKGSIVEYNMKNKGVWQLLELSDLNFKHNVSFGIRVNSVRMDEMKGDVLFALPNLKK